VNRALPPGNRGNRVATAGRISGRGGTVPGPLRLVGGVAPNRETQQQRLNVIKHGGFARCGRETPCASTLPAPGKGGPSRLFLIDKHGARPVCASCRKLGPYGEDVLGAFVCAACVSATDAYILQCAEEVPELRDHRLKRWRTGCD
jgi:hypothetical protein